jgi:hypothetical protein
LTSHQSSGPWDSGAGRGPSRGQAVSVPLVHATMQVPMPKRASPARQGTLATQENVVSCVEDGGERALFFCEMFGNFHAMDRGNEGFPAPTLQAMIGCPAPGVSVAPPIAQHWLPDSPLQPGIPNRAAENTEPRKLLADSRSGHPHSILTDDKQRPVISIGANRLIWSSSFDRCVSHANGLCPQTDLISAPVPPHVGVVPHCFHVSTFWIRRLGTLTHRPSVSGLVGQRQVQ